MVHFVYSVARHAIAAQALDWANDDIRVFYVKTGSTCPTDKNADNLAAFATLGEHTGAGRQATSGRSLVRNDGQLRSELRCGNTTFSSTPALGAGEYLIGAVYYLHTGSDATAMPIVFTSDGFLNPDGTGIAPAGQASTLRPDATGVAWLE